MANGETIRGTDVLLYIKREGDAEYMLAACQVTTTYDSSRDVTTNKTKCGTTTTEGDLSATFSVDGEARFDIAAGDNAISFNELQDLNLSGDHFRALIKDIKEATPKIYMSGEVFISSLQLTADSDNVAQFSSEFSLVAPEDMVTSAADEPS